MKKLKLGFMQGRLSPKVRNQIQAFPFSNWKNELKIANNLSFKIMEWTIDDFNFHKNPIMNLKGLNEIKALKKKQKIEINSITCDFLMQDNFYKKKIIDKKKKNNFLKFLNHCSQIKIKTIVVPLVDKSSIKNLVEEKNIISFFSSFKTFLKKKRMNVAFESDFNPERLKKFIKKFDPKVFGINYDIGNSAGLNYSYKSEMNAYFRKIKNVHIKDKNKENITVPLFSGKAKILEIMSYMLKNGYKGNFILQPARSKFDHVNMIKNYKKIFTNYDYKI
jgi:L-ribulose-5-phosphate 3-epimerase